MGLCKCPKKKVTNQFCFEHRVNVCEHCMVSNHSKCVVQSYLQWLQDSDYDPNCQLCKIPLAESDCIRLTCYHVFHWECLNRYASQLPSQTSPSEYICPICKMCIFPPSNVVSPVNDALKNALLGVSWARTGLGFSNGENFSEQDGSISSNIHPSPKKMVTTAIPFENKNKLASLNATKINSKTNQMEINNTRPEPYGASYTAPFSTPRKLYDATEHGHYRPSMIDHDEDKYKRRSAFEWFARWFKSRTSHGNSRQKDPHVFYKKRVVILILFLIALCTICIIFLRLGRANADSDPLLDPHFNPNIRIEDNGEEMQLGASNEQKHINQNMQNVMKDKLPA